MTKVKLIDNDLLNVTKGALSFVKSNTPIFIAFYALMVTINILTINFSDNIILNKILWAVIFYIYVYFLNLTYKIITNRDDKIIWYKYNKVNSKILFEIIATIIGGIAFIEILSIPVALIGTLLSPHNIETIIIQNTFIIEALFVLIYVIILYYLMCVSSIIVAFKYNFLDSLVAGIKLFSRLKFFVLFPLIGSCFNYLLTKIVISTVGLACTDGLVALLNFFTCVIIFNYFELKQLE